MVNLTKQYFDKKLDDLATKADRNGLATKKDLGGSIKILESNLKQHTEREIVELAGMIERRFNEVEKRLDLHEEADELKVQMKYVD